MNFELQIKSHNDCLNLCLDPAENSHENQNHRDSAAREEGAEMARHSEKSATSVAWKEIYGSRSTSTTYRIGANAMTARDHRVICYGFEGDGDGTIERFDTILLVIARRSFPLLECDFYGRY